MSRQTIPEVTDLSLRNLKGRSTPLARSGVSPAAALGLSAVALAVALQVNFGQYDPVALGWLALSILFTIVAVVGIARDDRATIPTMPVLSVGLGAQFLILLCTNPMATLAVKSPNQLLPFRVGVVCAAVLVVVAMRNGGWGRVAWWMVLGVHFLLGMWVLRAMPQPGVDVCLFQREAGRVLLGGGNPYAMTFPNLYSDASRVYGVGTFAGDRLLFGFPYPPLSLLLVLPGQSLGDFRISHLLATTLAGALIAAARPGRVATAAAALFLFTPRGLFVLEAGWTEPLAVLLLAMVVFFACREKSFLFESRLNEGGGDGSSIWGLVISLALLLVVKQYMILIAPLGVWLLWPQRARMLRQILVAIVIAMCVTVPMALWHLRAFMWSVVLLQFHQPVRPDALSFLPRLIELTRIPGATALPFLVVLAMMVWSILRLPRNPAAFAAATALMFLLFFAFNKQAFCNYYFLVIGGLCCAVAAADGRAEHAVQPEVMP
jgi:hypothetical protein